MDYYSLLFFFERGGCLKKRLILLTLLILSIPCIFTFYNTALTEKGSDEITNIYIKILEDLYHQDSGLNSGIKMIVISTDQMKNISESGKQKILKNFEKYGYEVINKSFHEIEREGLISGMTFSNGILLDIYDNSVENNQFTYSAGKWRSATGAVFELDGVIEYKNNHWVVKERGGFAIS